MSFCKRLKYLRATNEMTVSSMAREAGLSRYTYSRIESGKRRPTMPELEAIADALGVKLYDLFAYGGSDDIHFEHGNFCFVPY